MNKRSNEDFIESVEMSADMARAAEEEEKRLKALEDDSDDDDDDDLDPDFDLLGDDDDDDDSDDDDDLDAGDDDDDDDTDDDDDDDDEQLSVSDIPKVKKGQKQKPLSKAQKRIKKLAGQRREAEEHAFNTEMELIEERKKREALEQRVESLEKGGGPAPKTIAKPNPADFEYGEVDSKYVDALVEYRTQEERQRIRDEESDRSKQEDQERQAKHYKKRLDIVMSEGKEKYPDDFETLVGKLTSLLRLRSTYWIHLMGLTSHTIWLETWASYAR